MNLVSEAVNIPTLTQRHQLPYIAFRQQQAARHVIAELFQMILRSLDLQIHSGPALDGPSREGA